MSATQVLWTAPKATPALSHGPPLAVATGAHVDAGVRWAGLSGVRGGGSPGPGHRETRGCVAAWGVTGPPAQPSSETGRAGFMQTRPSPNAKTERGWPVPECPHSLARALWSGCLCRARYLFCVVTTTVVVFVGASAGGLLDFFQEKGSLTAMSDSGPLVTLTSRKRPTMKLEKQSSSSSLQRPGLLEDGAQRGQSRSRPALRVARTLTAATLSF